MRDMPRSAPPSDIPQRSQVQQFRVDQYSIRHYLFRFTYVWMTNGHEFWMFPTNVSNTTVMGFRWNWRFGWSFTGISLRNIAAFTCR